MKSSKYICTECGTDHDIPAGTDLSFAICANCSAMGEWATSEGAESQVVEKVESEEPESTPEGETEPATDLILIEENMSLADIWKPENVDAMIAKLEQYKDDFKGNVKTAKGRKTIISFSRKFSSSKILVDDMGKELIEEWQTKTKAVNTQRKKWREACDKFRDESRKPVTDYENAEKLVIANQNTTLARLVDLYNVAGDLDVATYEAYVAEVNAIVIDGDADFIERGNREKEQTLNSLEQKLTAKIQYNKDQADLAKLREAEEKRQAEESKKTEEKERKANEKKIKLQAKKDADAKAAEKIAEAKEAEETAKAEKKEAAKKAEADKKKAAEDAEADKKAAVAAAKKKADDEAKQKEKDRLAKIEEKRLADEERAADKENRGRINNAILEYLVANFDISDSAADAIVGDLDEGKIPHTSVDY